MLKTELLKMKEHCGLTNAEIAAKSKVAPQTVDNVFSGRTKDPGYETLNPIVKAMGFTMSDLEGAIPSERQPQVIMPCVKCQEKLDKIRDLYERMVASRDETIKAQALDLKDREKTAERIQKEHEKIINTKNKWLTALFVITGIVIAAFIAMCILDVMLPTIGWITYQI